MGEYFKPWRRKIGVLTLLLACMFAAGWARSLIVIDLINFPTGRETAIAFSSTGCSINIRAGYDEEVFNELEWDTLLVEPWQPGTSMVPGEPDEADEPELVRRYKYPIYPHDYEPVDWTLRLLGFGVGVTPFEFSDTFRQHYLMIPYWSVVIPLTLLSAFLLISKSHKSIQKKIVEPNPENVS